MTRPAFTADSPRLLSMLLPAQCAFGSVTCEERAAGDRARFWYPQQVWDDLYGKPWTVNLAGERWFQNMSRWDPTIKRGEG